MTRLLFILSFLFAFSLGCKNPTEHPGQSSKTESSLQVLPVKYEERSFTYLEREIEYLMNIWPGEYDNVEQLDFDKMAAKDKKDPPLHARMHSFIQRMDLPKFGEYVVYEESYTADDPTKVYRQVLYKLVPDEVAKAIRLEVFHVKNPAPLLSIKKTLDFSKNMNPGSSRIEKGCDMILKREGIGFLGKTIEKACIRSTTNPKQSIDFQLRISEGEFAFEEKVYDPMAESYLADEYQKGPFLLEKARCFVCMVDFPREKNGRPVETKHYIEIHDQGGKFAFDYSDGRHMVLGMRNTWSFGMQRETFVIFIQEGSQSGPTLIYSWGAPGADRIGFNPGWIRVQCDLANEQNIKFQQQLRPDS